MKTSVKAVLYLLTWLHLSAIGCHGVTVFPMVISPREPINGENATLECYAIDYDPALHSWKWRKRTNGTFVDISADERIEFLPVQQEPPTSYSGSMAINRLEESDEGQYNCEVVATSSGTIVGNSAANLFVNYPNEFPVCFPEGPSTVTEGDTLSCKTVVEERTPEVRLVDDPASEPENWVENSAGENVSGSELIKNVMIADDNSTFYCFSRLGDVRKTLSCTIGPLTVTPQPTTPSPLNPPTTALPIPAIAGIAAGGFLLLLLLLFALCCGCNPKRCFRPKTYLLNFTGIFGSSPKEDAPGRDMEMGQNNLGALPGSPTGDQRMFSFDENAEDNLTVPATEPNVYANHVVPGPSTSSFVPDPNENWHEIDLKAEIARAFDEEEEGE